MSADASGHPSRRYLGFHRALAFGQRCSRLGWFHRSAALGTFWPAIVVGVTVFFLVIVASADLLSCVPANVYGYAALVGYTLSAGKLDALTAGDNSNPLFLLVISAILGAVLGYLMGQLAGVLKTTTVR